MTSPVRDSAERSMRVDAGPFRFTDVDLIPR
jgi:hypothetical protein